MHIATDPTSRVRWMTLQVWFAYVFYVSLISYLVLELIGLPVVFAVAIGWTTWRRRARVGENPVG